MAACGITLMQTLPPERIAYEVILLRDQSAHATTEDDSNGTAELLLLW